VTKDTLLRQIAAKKAEFDWLRPQAPHGLDNLNQSYEIEMTYTATTIESNPLTAAETRMGSTAFRHSFSGLPPNYHAVLYTRSSQLLPA
jgi:hypothetical protein